MILLATPTNKILKHNVPVAIYIMWADRYYVRWFESIIQMSHLSLHYLLIEIYIATYRKSRHE